MTNQECISRIRFWQHAAFFHPLTCGNDSNHHVLEPVEQDGEVILVCLDCDYRQTGALVPPADLFPKNPQELRKLCAMTFRPYPSAEWLKELGLDHLIENRA